MRTVVTVRARRQQHTDDNRVPTTTAHRITNHPTPNPQPAPTPTHQHSRHVTTMCIGSPPALVPNPTLFPPYNKHHTYSYPPLPARAVSPIEPLFASPPYFRKPRPLSPHSHHLCCNFHVLPLPRRIRWKSGGGESKTGIKKGAAERGVCARRQEKRRGRERIPLPSAAVLHFQRGKNAGKKKGGPWGVCSGLTVWGDEVM